MFGLQDELLDAWAAPKDGRPSMTSADVVRIIVAVVLVLLAALLAAAETAVTGVSRARVEELAARRSSGCERARTLSPTRRWPSTRCCCCAPSRETDGSRPRHADVPRRWCTRARLAALVTVLADGRRGLLVVGVAPRTLGRQHAESYALAVARPVRWLSILLAPLTRLLIALGNALTPGRGFRDGPFASEAELRDLVDLAEQSQLIEHDERDMIHSVFELGDTIVREVMVPRAGDGRHRARPHPASGHVARPAQRVQPHPGDRRRHRRRPRRRLPQGRHPTDLRAPRGRVVGTGRVGHAAGGLSCPTASRPPSCSATCRRSAPTSPSSSTSTAARPVWSRSRTSSRRSSARSPTSTTPVRRRSRSCRTATYRVSARYDVWDFAARFGLRLDEDEDDDVDTVGGLLGQAARQGADRRVDRRRRRLSAGRRVAHGTAQPDQHHARAADPATEGSARARGRGDGRCLSVVAGPRGRQAGHARPGDTRPDVGVVEGAAVRDEHRPDLRRCRGRPALADADRAAGRGGHRGRPAARCPSRRRRVIADHPEARRGVPGSARASWRVRRSPCISPRPDGSLQRDGV